MKDAVVVRRIWEWLIRVVPWTSAVAATLIVFTPAADLKPLNPRGWFFLVGMFVLLWIPAGVRMARIYRERVNRP
jgi:membrane protein YdbS with pleckstrin-like domain